MATFCSKTSAMFIQPYLCLQHAGHMATFTIYVSSPTSVFGALSLFSFDAFVWADALSWAHKHSCNQATWILLQGENGHVWCVSNRSVAVDSSVCTCPWVLVQSRSALQTPWLAIAMVPKPRAQCCWFIFLITWGLQPQYTELLRLVASKTQVYVGTSVLHCSPSSRYPQVHMHHAHAAGQGGLYTTVVTLLCSWKHVRQCWLIQNNEIGTQKILFIATH